MRLKLNIQEIDVYCCISLVYLVHAFGLHIPGYYLVALLFIILASSFIISPSYMIGGRLKGRYRITYIPHNNVCGKSHYLWSCVGFDSFFIASCLLN